MKQLSQYINESIEYPSTYEVAQRVRFKIGNIINTDQAYVRAVTFTNGKVRYSLRIKIPVGDEFRYSTLHNIDSIWVVDGFEVDEEMFINELDNYS